jgi:O-methyltransferase involved in polyketide biosynthesis
MPDMEALTNDGIRAFGASQRAKGIDLADPSELAYLGERNSVVEYLDKRGWRTSTVTVEDEFVANGLAFPSDDAMTGFFNASYTSAQLS